MKNKIIAVLICLLPVVLCSSALTKPDKPKPKNLKVLPKDISHEELDKVMDGFKTALGVRCGFCHAKSAADSTKLDFASDANKHKDIARYMMKMTMRINKKYFKQTGEHSMMKVDCITCHNGQKEPKS